MGATASSSSSSTALPEKKYDVFVSFRGEDTRGGFISHLRAHLRRKNIEVYIDDRLGKGDEISNALTQAIQDSHISVVVFSKNYASSKWCLNELTKILECKNQDGQIVIPVFYEIDPSHVRNQTESYMEAFIKHEQELKDKEKLHKWKVSLNEAANLAGWDSRNFRDQYTLIENIVDDILQKLDHRHPCELQDVVGIDESVEHITALLSKVPIVGIWGMGGIGKTTICKAIFAKLSSEYEGCCFLENVREESEKHGLNYLRYKLLNELLKREENRPTSENQVLGSTFSMRRLYKKKVFIVLDDVTNFEQVTCLARGYLCLRPDSGIILTSRDKHLLTSLRVHEIYKVKKLNNPESLKLFCLNAFNKNYPDMGFEQLSGKVLAYAKGIPLALKVLGSYLHSKTNEEWESALAKLKKVPNKDIVSVLKLSYDELNYEEQEIFLDIACFLNGKQKAHVINLLDSYGFYGAIGIRTLVDKALITISASNQVMMHDLIKQIGWEIVRGESIKEPGRRTRLWDFEEVYDVLRYNKGTDANEGTTLDVSQTRDLHLSADTFKKMPNLRFLKFYSFGYWYAESSLHSNIDSFSAKLRYFQWHGYPSPSLPSTFCAEKLVVFSMPNSHIRKLWDGVQDLVNLKTIDLRGSTQLMELPDFSKASTLEVVYLQDCSGLCHVHPSLLHLHSLVELNLKSCVNIKSLQSEIHLRSLERLNVAGCLSLKEFSLSSEKLITLNLI